MTNTRAALVFLGILLVLGVTLTGCGSKGQYTSYSEQTVNSETSGLTEAAMLSISRTEPNCILHEPVYNLSIKTDGPTHKQDIYLTFISDAIFTQPDAETVEVTASTKLGMRTKSTNKSLAAKIDKAVIKLEHQPEFRFHNIQYSVKHYFNISISLLDKDDKILGKYSHRILDATSQRVLSDTSAPVTMISEDALPNSVSGIFLWASARAKTCRLSGN